ncbi:MAG TPA: 4a-hydroxytetrahydrobiopterin dehydratase [Thermoanaerobaculaceae bacterium]|nr:4a-hydroxytetrahydrobiopterin dehydratase [Thermoanaerobaculaceae bacterium]HRS15987.1 4a-hydroxytetrahydrobiopterin dehydratase [Thermoanaerobaculaceae bacterium]
MVSGHLAERIAAELPGWRLQGFALTARWAFPDFSSALAATVRIGMLAERADHHPDLELGWGYLGVSLTTHSAGGVTEKDLDLAFAIQALLGAPS